MPLLFLIAGLLLIVTAIRGTTGAFAGRLWGDVSSRGFLTWVAAIIVIGGLGYIPALKEPSRYLLGLLILVIFLTNGKGFISQFVAQIEHPGQATAAQQAGGNPNLPAIPVQSQASGSPAPGANNATSLFSPSNIAAAIPAIGRLL